MNLEPFEVITDSCGQNMNIKTHFKTEILQKLYFSVIFNFEALFLIMQYF